MKLQGARVEGFISRPDVGVRAVLLYGPDHGLVRDRAERLGRTVVADLSDPFQVAELTGALVAEEPARLVDEVGALSLMGGRRLVRVREAGDSATAAFTSMLEGSDGGDTLVVAEGGELDGRSKLRRLFEGAANAAAIACYVEESQDLARSLGQLLTAQHLTADRDALALLTQNLVGDRMLVKGEIDKLAIYMGPDGGRVGEAEIRAVIADSAQLELDDPVWCAADGDHKGLERALSKLLAEGTAAVALLRAAQRHFQRLHLASGMMAAGASAEAALAALRPPVFYKETARFTAEMRRWGPQRLRRALDLLTTAEMACKSSGAPDTLLTVRLFHDLAQLAQVAPKTRG